MEEDVNEIVKENFVIREDRKQLLIWRVLFGVICGILVVIVVLYACGVGWKKKTDSQNQKKEEYESILSLWKDTAESKQKLISYMKEITNNSSNKYIPPDSRIAVFDFDGTIFCETDTLYFDWLMYSYRVLKDPVYSLISTDEEKELGRDIKYADIHNLRKDLQMRHANAYPKAFMNMSFDDLEKYVKDYMKFDALGFDNMKRGEAFYEPMVQLIEYLQANEFLVYLCSGSDRHILRTVAKSRLKLPDRQITGTIATVAASGQPNRSDFNYVYEPDDFLIMGGEFKFKNVKMNKVSLIKTEIGKQPVLSFGNSNGDYSMARYVTNKNKYESLAFMVCCDDLDREYGNTTKADAMKQKCKEEDRWVSISMKDDWSRIYAENVKKKAERIIE
jgi:beta-phosphoglucomutase-like phosphatase (HAD superfamily)